MKLRNVLAVICGACICLSGCMQNTLVPENQSLNSDVASSEISSDLKLYRFNTGDSLRVLVYGENDLSATYKINAEGTISFPLIGMINMAGLNVYEAEKEISAKLANGYLKNPSVSVEVIEYRPFSVLGEVNDAGNYDFKEGMSIADAIASAGGFTYRAHKDQFETLRRSDDGWDRVFTSINGPLLPGDVIYVRERLF